MDPSWLDQLYQYINGPGLNQIQGLRSLEGLANPGGPGGGPGYPSSPYNAPPGAPGTVPPGGRVQTPWGPGVVPNQTPSGPMPGPGVPVGQPYSGQTGVIPAGPATSPIQLPAPVQSRPMMPAMLTGATGPAAQASGGASMPGGANPAATLAQSVQKLLGPASKTLGTMGPMAGSAAAQPSVYPSVQALAAQHTNPGGPMGWLRSLIQGQPQPAQANAPAPAGGLQAGPGTNMPMPVSIPPGPQQASLPIPGLGNNPNATLPMNNGMGTVGALAGMPIPQQFGPGQGIPMPQPRMGPPGQFGPPMPGAPQAFPGLGGKGAPGMGVMPGIPYAAPGVGGKGLPNPSMATPGPGVIQRMMLGLQNSPLTWPTPWDQNAVNTASGF